MKIVAVSGGFVPLHIGHLENIRGAKSFGYLMVILTRDDQLLKKKGYVFMPYKERRAILESLRWVDMVVENIDTDLSSNASLRFYRPNIFARGGDILGKDNLRESATCKELGIEIRTGTGGNEKIQSSQGLVRRANETILRHG